MYLNSDLNTNKFYPMRVRAAGSYSLFKEILYDTKNGSYSSSYDG